MAAPIKFVQLVSFYDRYLDDFYRRRPGLEHQPYKVQLHALLSDYFCALHIFAPTMQQFGYETTLVIVSAKYLNLQWARENGITEVNAQGWQEELVRRQIEAVQPDVLYVSHPVDQYDSSFVRSLKCNPRLVIGWRAAEIPNHTDWSRYDVILSHLSRCRERAISHGARRAVRFHPGVPAVLGEIAQGTPKKFDLVITGQWTPQHAQRNRFIEEIVSAIEKEELKVSLGLFLAVSDEGLLPPLVRARNQGAVWASDMHRAIASGRVVLNAEIDLAGGEAGNMRLFEVTATGSFLLTQHHANLADYFTPGEEVVSFSSSQEAIQKIRYYVENESERERIARAGQRACLERFSIAKVCQRLHEIIQEELSHQEQKNGEAMKTEAEVKLVETLNALSAGWGKESVWDRARIALTRGEYPEAVKIFEALPSTPLSRYGLAVSFAYSGRIDEARKVLQELSSSPFADHAQRLRGGLGLSSLADGSPTPAQKVVGYMTKAVECVNAEKVHDAIAALIEAKKLRFPVQDLDYLRAVCFLRVNRIGEARESLKEELRYYPQNAKAIELLAQVEKIEQQQRTTIYQGVEPEFLEVHRAISKYTMAPIARLYSLYCHARSLCERGIPGNFVECGVAAGGSSALLAWVIGKYSKVPRTLFSFDSFEGMPVPTAEDVQAHSKLKADATGWGTGTCAAPEVSLREVCRNLGVESIVQPVKGYFQDTLPVWKSRVGTVAFLHLDGDWYESTKVILDELYDAVSHDGVLQVDDYGHWEGCKKALHEFEAKRGFQFKLNSIDGEGVWLNKPSVGKAQGFGIN